MTLQCFLPLFCFKICFADTEHPVTTSLSLASGIGSRCVECGTTKKSGKLSCCARGGSWFKNCGDGGDSKFDHTWAEGIQACKGKLCRVSLVRMSFIVVDVISMRVIVFLRRNCINTSKCLFVYLSTVRYDTRASMCMSILSKFSPTLSPHRSVNDDDEVNWN